MALLTVKDLAVGYETGPVAEHIDFELNMGDFLCVVGENGSGKTTLMKTLLRLVDPLGGEILMGDGLRRNEIGYLPQQTAVQKDFPASVREVVMSGCEAGTGWRPFYNRDDRKTAERNMARMGISRFAGRCYRELSGGQQQRVLLARALCATERMLLLDEPVSGLDPRATQEMYDLIRDLNESGVTIIMISHDIEAAINYASHVLHVGKQIFFGTRDEYVRSRQGMEFLGQGVQIPAQGIGTVGRGDAE